MSILVICDAGIADFGNISDKTKNDFVCGFGWVIVKDCKLFLRRKAKTFTNKQAYHTNVAEFYGIITAATDVYITFNNKNESTLLYCDNQAAINHFIPHTKKNWKKDNGEMISRFMPKDVAINFRQLTKLSGIQHINSGSQLVNTLHRLSHRLAKLAINDETGSYLLNEEEQKKYFGLLSSIKDTVKNIKEEFSPYYKIF